MMDIVKMLVYGCVLICLAILAVGVFIYYIISCAFNKENNGEEDVFESANYGQGLEESEGVCQEG